MTKPAALKRGRLLCTKPTKPLFTKNLNLFFSKKKRKKKKKPMNEMYVCMSVCMYVCIGPMSLLEFILSSILTIAEKRVYQ